MDVDDQEVDLPKMHVTVKLDPKKQQNMDNDLNKMIDSFKNNKFTVIDFIEKILDFYEKYMFINIPKIAIKDAPRDNNNNIIIDGSAIFKNSPTTYNDESVYAFFLTILKNQVFDAEKIKNSYENLQKSILLFKNQKMINKIKQFDGSIDQLIVMSNMVYNLTKDFIKNHQTDFKIFMQQQQQGLNTLLEQGNKIAYEEQKQKIEQEYGVQLRVLVLLCCINHRLKL